MHDDASIYFVLVYRRREPVLVMKRVKSQAMLLPSWKFEGKPNSIPAQFFFGVCVFFEGFFVFGGSLFFRSLFLRGSSFSRSSFFRGSSFSRSSVFGLRFLDTQWWAGGA